MPRNTVQDGNQVFSTLLVAGSAGTADTAGTSQPVAASGDPATGAQYVYNLGPAGSVSLGDITGGTIDLISAVGGTVDVNIVGGATSGTSVQVEHGTIESATVTNGTIRVTAGTIGAGTINTLGTVSNILAGTIQNSGTVTGVGVLSSLTSGTIQSATITGGTINAATVSVNTPGTITSGSIAVIAGTIGAGTLNTLGTVSNILAGTIQNSGTVTGVGVVSNVTNGSVRITAGTVTPATGADAAVPFAVRLTDGTSFYNASGGAGGGTSVQVEHGTIESVTTVSNITNGTIRVTAGTINSGTINAGTINTGTVEVFPLAGGDPGTALTVRLTDGTSFYNASGAGGGTSVEIVTGTVGLVSTVSNLTNGTVRVTAGTINSGTINAGTITEGTLSLVTTVSNLTNGSVRVTAGTVNSGTINAGTVTSQPYPASQVLPAFAIGTAAVGTLVSAPGAGNGIYINSISLAAMSGTLDMCLSFGLGSTTNQVVNRGLYIAGGGIAQSFDFPSFYGTANSPLTYQILGGAGTASWQVNYVTKGTP